MPEHEENSVPVSTGPRTGTCPGVQPRVRPAEGTPLYGGAMQGVESPAVTHARPPANGSAGGRHARRDGVLIAGLAIVVLAGAVLRLTNLDSGIPDNIHPDEPTVVERALAALRGEIMPPRFDWPPASAYLLAAMIAVARLLPEVTLEQPSAVYAFGRLVFVCVSLVVVLLTGLVAARLGRSRAHRRLLAWGAAASVAVSFLSIAFSQLSHPDHLQLVFMLAALLSALAFDRRRSGLLLLAAGLLAGLAGATKYFGTAAAAPALAAVWWAAAPAFVKLRQSALVAAGVATGFVGGTLGTVLDVDHFLDGFLWQVRHQAAGHLGFEADTNALWFHLTSSLPGNWGWPLTVLAVGGAVAMLLRGDRDERLVAGFCVLLLAVTASSNVLFPRYALTVVPFLAPCAFVGLHRLWRVLPRAGVLAVAAVVAVTVGVTVADDVRLLRARGALDTRTVATSVLDGIEGPVWTERYALPLAATGVPRAFEPDREFSSFGEQPQVLDCDCVAVITSYREERYRRRPDLYAEEIAVYDGLRERGRTIAAIEPAADLSYRWTGLPQWGLRNIPLVGPIGRVGPTITVLDLRGPE